jgi:hypothetical protein
MTSKLMEPLGDVVYPNGGVCSLTTLMPDGTMVEAATVGDEGILGIEAFFGDDPIAAGETMVQVPNGSIVGLSVHAFRKELGERGGLHDIIGRYAQVTFAIDCVQRAPPSTTALCSMALDDT